MEAPATSSLPSPSLWTSVNSWFTSTVLFILLNLMIATILFTSNLTQNNQPPQEQEANNDDKDQQKETQKQIQKQPSILTRLKSFTLEYNNQDDDDNHHAHQPIELAATQYVFNQPMHYQHFDFDQPTENIATHYDFNDKYSGKVVSGADKFSGEFSDKVQENETEDTLLDSEPTREEILDRNGLEDEFESMDDVYSKLVDSKNSKKMKKSRSLKVGFKDDHDDDMAAVEARRPETVRVKKKVAMVEEEDDDDDDVEVDSRADDFINKFKNDLKLQRIESIMKKGGNKLK